MTGQPQDAEQVVPTTENTIFPTHECYDDAVANMKFLIEHERALLTSGELLIVHGIINPDGKELAHAWLELRGKVWDSGFLRGQRITFEADQEEFYREAKVSETTKYTPIDAAREELRCGHYGPWVERYRAMALK